MNAPKESTPIDPETSAWEAARQAGLDMDLLQDCLDLTPTERLRLHALAVLTAERLRAAMEARPGATADAP